MRLALKKIKTNPYAFSCINLRVSLKPKNSIHAIVYQKIKTKMFLSNYLSQISRQTNRHH